MNSAVDRIGFIGLGVMGQPMASNLVRAGYPVVVHSRRASSLEPLAALGAVTAACPADVARQSNVVITMVPDSQDVVAVTSGPNGLFAGASAGSTWIDMSTISPVVSRRLAHEAADLRIDALDAPVSGGEQGAIDGALTIMIGGSAAVYERCRPIFDVLGKTVVHLGDSGAGQVAKACNQMIVGVTIGVVAEALLLGKSAGVDPRRIREALLGGFAQSRVLETHGARMLDAAYTPGFRARLHQKDVRIAREIASQYDAPTPLTDELAILFDELIAAGGCNLDHSALAHAYEARSNRQVLGEGTVPTADDAKGHNAP